MSEDNAPKIKGFFSFAPRMSERPVLMDATHVAAIRGLPEGAGTVIFTRDVGAEYETELDIDEVAALIAHALAAE